MQRSRHLLFLAVGFVGSLLAACGPASQTPPAPNVNVSQPDKVEYTQANSRPQGTIQGLVTDESDGTPLDGVTVAVLVDGQAKQTTSTQGVYALTGIPAGATYRATFSKPGYAKQLASATLPATAGDFPQGNVIAELNLGLFSATSTVTGTVKSRQGAPLAGVKVRSDLRSMGFDIVALATTAADGTFTLSSLPGTPTGLALSFSAGPVDTDGDGWADFGFATASAKTYPKLSSTVKLVLPMSSGARGNLVANGGFEGTSGCALDGWTVSPSTGSTAPTTSTSVKAEGSCSVRLGAPVISGTYSGTSSIQQDILIPDGVTTLTFSAQYSPDTNYAASGHDQQLCELRTIGGSQIAELFDVITNTQTFTPATATANVAAYAGQTIRVYCHVYLDGAHASSMYLDDVVVALQ